MSGAGAGLAATAVTALVCLLAACSAASPSLAPTTPASSAVTGSPSSPSFPSFPSSPSSVAVPGPADLTEAARTAGTPATSGVVTLTVAAATVPVQVAQNGDGSVALTITVAARAGIAPEGASRPVTAVVAAASGMRFVARSDRSIVVVGTAGEAIGALLPAHAADDAGATLGAELVVRAGDDTLLDVRVDPGSAGAAHLTFGATALVSARWGEREGGRSLAVVPAPWVRAGSLAAQDALWSAIVAAEPDADSTTMHDQLSCHALGAPDKDAWNLEPWRPEVDSFTLLAARCNP